MNKKIFIRACELFFTKWDTPTTTEFAKYFKDNWVNINFNWFAGATEGFPVTNNALEATNNVVKKHDTLREKVVMSEFLAMLTTITQDWSQARDPMSPNYRPFNTSVTVSQSELQRAKTWKSDTFIQGKGNNYYAASALSSLEVTGLKKF